MELLGTILLWGAGSLQRSALEPGHENIYVPWQSTCLACVKALGLSTSTIYIHMGMRNHSCPWDKQSVSDDSALPSDLVAPMISLHLGPEFTHQNQKEQPTTMLRFERDVEDQVMTYTYCNPVTWEVKAGRSGVQAQPWLGGQPELYGYSSYSSGIYLS